MTPFIWRASWNNPNGAWPVKVDRLGLIAGNGKFPLQFSIEAARLGLRVTAIAHEEETDPDLKKAVDRIHWVKVGQLGRIIDLLKEEGLSHLVLLGGITKARLFSGARPDLRGAALLVRVKSNKDDAILRAVADEIEKEGIEVKSAAEVLPSLVVREGVMTRCAPTPGETEDIETGFRAAKVIGRLDIGQCVVVKDRVIVAVEGVDGTDETIRRGGRLVRGGAVVVKVCKPGQDLRFDMPAIGPVTIDTMAEAKARVLAVEAGGTLCLDRERTLAAADRAGIAVVGIDAARPGPEKRDG